MVRFLGSTLSRTVLHAISFEVATGFNLALTFNVQDSSGNLLPRSGSGGAGSSVLVSANATFALQVGLPTVLPEVLSSLKLALSAGSNLNTLNAGVMKVGLLLSVLPSS